MPDTPRTHTPHLTGLIRERTEASGHAGGWKISTDDDLQAAMAAGREDGLGPDTVGPWLAAVADDSYRLTLAAETVAARYAGAPDTTSFPEAGEAVAAARDAVLQALRHAEAASDHLTARTVVVTATEEGNAHAAAASAWADAGRAIVAVFDQEDRTLGAAQDALAEAEAHAAALRSALLAEVRPTLPQEDRRDPEEWRAAAALRQAQGLHLAAAVCDREADRLETAAATWQDIRTAVHEDARRREGGAR